MPDTSPNSHRLLRGTAQLVAVLLWCGVIFAFSARANLRVADDDFVDFIVRKCAHVAVFAVLCVLAIRALHHLRVRPPRAIAAAWLFCLLYACSDEWHQTFVRGRVGSPRDVLIDMVGVSAAALVAWRITRRTQRTTPPEAPR